MAPSRKRKAADSSRPIVKLSLTNRGRTNKRVKTARLTATDGCEDNKTTFMSLSGELRNEIYHLVLDEDDVVRIRPRKRSWRWYEWHNKAATVQKTPWREPGILRANKMIRNEAFDMYYKFNDFEICLRLTEAADVTDWLRTIVRRCGNDPFRQFNFYMLRCNWVDLQHARSLVEFFRDNELIFRPITFEFTPRPIWGWGELWRDYSLKDNQSLFHMLDATSRLARCALEEAVDLGKRARRENWTEDWLDVEFGFWFDEKMSKEGAKALRDMILTRKQKAKSEAARHRFSWS